MNSHKPERGRARVAFTAIELMVVVGVIVILIAILMPILQSTRENSRQTACLNNLRQIGIGLHDYHASNGAFPAGRDAKSFRQHNWATKILSLADQSSALDEYSFEHRWDWTEEGVRNGEITSTLVPLYRCPTVDHQHPGEGDYGGNYGSSLTGLPRGFAPNEAWSSGVLVAVNIPGIRMKPIGMKDIRDGASSTFLVLECAGLLMERGGGWGNGHHNVSQDAARINMYQAQEIFAFHPTGANCVLADGSVHFLNEQMEPELIGALCSRQEADETNKWY